MATPNKKQILATVKSLPLDELHLLHDLVQRVPAHLINDAVGAAAFMAYGRSYRNDPEALAHYELAECVPFIPVGSVEDRHDGVFMKLVVALRTPVTA